MHENNYSALIAFPRHKLNEFSAKLRLEFPNLKTFDFAVLELMDKEFELNNIDDFDYLILASSFAAEIFAKKIKLIPEISSNLPLILSIGPSITKILNTNNLNVYKQANQTFNIAGLIEEIKESIIIKNKKFLFLGQEKSHSSGLEKLIIDNGGKFEKLNIYKSSIPGNPDWESLNNFVKAVDNYKILVFSSPEGVKSFHNLINSRNTKIPFKINPAKIFCLGSLTQKEALKHWPNNICLCPENDYSYDSLIELIKRNLSLIKFC